MKTGFKTLEFWLGAFVAVAAMILPEFPKESAYAVINWIVNRAAQKGFGVVDADGKPSWRTSEFWASVGWAIAKVIFPDLPADSLYPIVAYVETRTGVKILSTKRNK